MGATLDEFFNSSRATRRLVEDLENNMEAFGDALSKEDREHLMRTNLIMIRQCLEDFRLG